MRGVALLLLLILGLGAAPVAGKLLPEATVLTGVDGRLTHADPNDAWWFELTAEVKSETYQVPAGTRFVLLGSGVLERLITDVNDRYRPEYRLTAQVTQYEGKNYLLATYFLPLSAFKSDETPDGAQPPPIGGAILPADPELTIPPEIVERLQNSRPTPRPLRKESDAPKGKPTDAYLGRMLVNRVGLIEAGGGKDLPPATGRLFVPYALGWNVSDVRYELLPCKALEWAQRMQRNTMEPIRFSVAGLVTQFQGRQYLLLQRATPVYNYGNFGR